MVFLAFLPTWVQSNEAPQIPLPEREALIALYNSTNGDSWTDNSGWLDASGTECSWFGITCDSTESNATAIDLPFNGLEGSLPEEIGQLTELERLSAFNAELSGTIPSSFSNLDRLSLLDLGTQRYFEPGGLTGDLRFLLQLPEIELVNPTANDFSGSIPAGISQLTKLRRVFLADNDNEPGLGAAEGWLVRSNDEVTGAVVDARRIDDDRTGITRNRYFELNSREVAIEVLP